MPVNERALVAFAPASAGIIWNPPMRIFCVNNKLAIVLFLILSCMGAPPFHLPAQESDFDKAVDRFVGDHLQMEATLSQLQHAAAIHDSKSVAAMVSYPIRVAPHGKALVIRTPGDFIARYNFIMTPEIVVAIRKQRYEELFVRDQGAMIGEGQVWFVGICLDRDCKHTVLKIKTIQEG